MRRFPISASNVLPLTVIAAVAASGVYATVAEKPFGLDLSREALAHWVASLGTWGGLGIIALMILHSFIPFPAEVVTFMAGHLYGPILGAFFAWVGAMLGAMLAFALARYAGRGALMGWLPEAARAKVDAIPEDAGAMALLLARFMPLIAFNLINYAAGLTKVGWWTFIWTTGLGILPLTILFAYLGERMRESSWQDWLLVAGAAVLLTFGVHALRRRIASHPGRGPKS